MGYGYCCCDPRCGFDSSFTRWTSVTTAGDMVFVRESAGGNAYRCRQTGSGSAAASGHVNLFDYGSPATTIRLTGTIGIESGVVWVGVRGGDGVSYDYATSMVSRVQIDSDGEIAATYESIYYPAEFQLTIALGWCRYQTHDRLTVGGLGAPLGTYRYPAVAHVVSAAPEGRDVDVCWGSTAVATQALWRVQVLCSPSCNPCTMYADQPTPSEAQVDWTGSLTLNPSAQFPISIPGDPLANSILGSGILGESGFFDSLGVGWTVFCRWIKPGYAFVNAGFNCSLVTTAELRLGDATQFGNTSGFMSVSYACLDQTAAFDASKYHLSIEFEIAVGVPQTSTHYTRALYEGPVTMDAFSANAFALIRVSHESRDKVTSVVSACASAESQSYVTGWPAGLDVTWI